MPHFQKRSIHNASLAYFFHPYCLTCCIVTGSVSWLLETSILNASPEWFFLCTFLTIFFGDVDLSRVILYTSLDLYSLHNMFEELNLHPNSFTSQNRWRKPAKHNGNVSRRERYQLRSKLPSINTAATPPRVTFPLHSPLHRNNTSWGFTDEHKNQVRRLQLQK